MTFTEKAGAELRDRLRAEFEARDARPRPSRASGTRASEALDDLDSAAIGTLHSFAQRILTVHPDRGRAAAAGRGARRGRVVRRLRGALGGACRRSCSTTPSSAERLLLALAAGVKLDHLRSRRPRLRRRLGPHRRAGAATTAPPRLPSPTSRTWHARPRVCERVPRSAADARTSSSPTWPTLAPPGASACASRPTTGCDWLRSSPRTSSGSATARRTTGPSSLSSRPRARTSKRPARCSRRHRSPRPPCARWRTGSRSAVQRDALARAAEGRLEFHDLLVLARELLRDRTAEVRGVAATAATSACCSTSSRTPTRSRSSSRRCIAARPTSADATGLARRRRADPARCSSSATRSSRSTASGAPTSRCTSRPGSGSPRATGSRLTTNFRTVEPVLAWVNARLRGADPAGRQGAARRTTPLGQPRARAAAAARRSPCSAPRREPDKVSADELRAARGRRRRRRDQPRARGGLDRLRRKRRSLAPPAPRRHRDPASRRGPRSALLESALDDADVAYRAESSSLVYQAAEVRDLLMAAARDRRPERPVRRA